MLFAQRHLYLLHGDFLQLLWADLLEQRASHFLSFVVPLTFKLSCALHSRCFCTNSWQSGTTDGQDRSLFPSQRSNHWQSNRVFRPRALAERETMRMDLCQGAVKI